jgi:hypothetical protein
MVHIPWKQAISKSFKNSYNNVKAAVRSKKNVKAVVPLLRNGFLFRPTKKNWIAFARLTFLKERLFLWHVCLVGENKIQSKTKYLNRENRYV